MKHLWLGAVALLVAESSAFAQKEFDVERHYWARHKVGTTATFTMAIDMGGQQMEGSYSQTLKEKSKASFTVTTAVDVGGQVQESEEIETLPKYVGEETLKVGGKEYKCTVWTSTSNREGEETTTKIWFTEAVKTPLQLEIKDPRETCVITAVKVSEKVSVHGKDYDCVAFEGELPTQMGKAKAKMWMNPEVPGMTVKLDMEVSSDMGAMKIALELKEVSSVK
jgi:hypothetical protein